MRISRSSFSRIPYRLQTSLGLDVVIPSPNGQLVIPLRSEAGRSVVSWVPTWKTEIIRRLVALRGGPFVDIGVNTGQTLLDLRSTSPTVEYVGFEPNLECVAFVRSLILANQFQDCVVVPIGLAGANQLYSLYRRTGSHTDDCATIVENLRPGRDYEVEFVPCYRFDDSASLLGLSIPGVVKIDVEGAEASVVEGMVGTLASGRPPILAEVLFCDQEADLEAQARRNDSLMRNLVQCAYVVLQLIKSPDGMGVNDLRQVDRFPEGYWSESNKELCDYLFLPTEVTAEAVTAIRGARPGYS